MATDERSRRSTFLAETALLNLIRQLGGKAAELVVIGGLTPDHLTAGGANTHIGTNDIDVLVSVAVVYDREEQDFSWLESGLQHAGFTPDPPYGSGWRWRTVIDDFVIKLDLLCDVSGHERNEPVALPGCELASAMNLPGTGGAFADLEHHELASDAARVDVRFTGIAGYLLSKGAAVCRRGAERDFYSFAYVLVHYREGGAETAARAASSAVGRDGYSHLRNDLLRAAGLYIDDDRPGAHAYASQSIDAGSEDSFETLLEDATGAALVLRTTLLEDHGLTDGDR
ncbi:MAG: hypothetical protein ACJ71T_04720 [Actinomycetales bacterium]